uniref:Uncharacterized protein n=1 Tax=Arundo donax TaxID=35708 RepID=A0A0A8YNM3_ARUDO
MRLSFVRITTLTKYHKKILVFNRSFNFQRLRYELVKP